MLAFPVAITAFELIKFIDKKIKLYRLSKNDNSSLSEQNIKTIKQEINLISWIMPLMASLSIVGWILFFDDIAPQAGMVVWDLPILSNCLCNCLLLFSNKYIKIQTCNKIQKNNPDIKLI